ncbi:hypothetical protein ACFZAU_40195 [Streptomyces sp. NPDC008238]
MRTPRTTAGTLSAHLLATTALDIATPAARAATAGANPAAGGSTAPSVRFADIPGAGGITLTGNLFTPSVRTAPAVGFGPLDVADVSEVVDRTLANTPADPGRIGGAGVPYGAGLALMEAAHDPRVGTGPAAGGRRSCHRPRSRTGPRTPGTPRRRTRRGSPYRFADRHSRSVRTSVRSRGLRT